VGARLVSPFSAVAQATRATQVSPLQLDPRIILIRRADVAERVERFGEQIVKALQPIDVLDHSMDGEAQFVHALGEFPEKPAFVILDLEMHGWLLLQKLAKFLVCE